MGFAKRRIQSEVREITDAFRDQIDLSIELAGKANALTKLIDDTAVDNRDIDQLRESVSSLSQDIYKIAWRNMELVDKANKATSNLVDEAVS